MNKGNWVAIDKNSVKTLGKLDRPYSLVEALVSFQVDVDCDRQWSINGYSELWGWSRNKVRKFVTELRTGRGHIADRKGTGKGQVIRFVDKGSQGEGDRKRTGRGQEEDRKRDTTINPNPKPNPKPKEEKEKHGRFANVLLSKKEHDDLAEKFSDLPDRIEALSLGIESKGYKYKSHFATILAWDRKEKRDGNSGGSGKKSTGFAEARKSGETDWLS